jgi:hypothetical protein
MTFNAMITLFRHLDRRTADRDRGGGLTLALLYLKYLQSINY